MKKITLLVAAVALISISCEKKYNWNCQCLINGTSTTDYTISEQTQEEAQESCDVQKAVYLASVNVTSCECTLIQTN